MRTERLELCVNCYEYPRQKTNALCRRCAAIRKAAEDNHERIELSGDGAHLRRLRASGRSYA